MRSSFLRIGEQYPSSGLRPSEGIAHQFFGMMTAFTDTSSPELPYSLSTSSESYIIVIAQSVGDCSVQLWSLEPFELRACRGNVSFIAFSVFAKQLIAVTFEGLCRFVPNLTCAAKHCIRAFTYIHCTVKCFSFFF